MAAKRQLFLSIFLALSAVSGVFIAPGSTLAQPDGTPSPLIEDQFIGAGSMAALIANRAATDHRTQ